MALAWLPGQSRAGAVRWWLAAGGVPMLVALQIARDRAVSRWVWPWLGLACIALVQAAWTPAPGRAVMVALTQLGWVAALALGAKLRAEDASLSALAPWAAAAGVAAASPQLVGVTGGTFGNPTLLAGFLVGTIALTVSAASRFKPLYLLAFTIQMAALVRCGSLGGFSVLVLAAGLAWAAQRGRRWGAALLVLGLLAGAATSGPGRAHVAGRAYLVQLTAEVGTSALPFGVGAGQLHGAFLEVQARRGASRHWTNAYHAHNEAAQVFAEQGPLALVLLLLPWMFAVFKARRQPTALALLGGLGAMCLVNPALYEPGSAFVLALAVGWSVGGDASIRWAILGRWLAPIVAAAALAVVSVDLVSDRLLVRGVKDARTDLLRAAAVGALRPSRALLARAKLEPTEGVSLIHEALRRDPSLGAWVQLGRLRWEQHDGRGAAEAFREAVRLQPRLFAGHFNLALVYDELGARERSQGHAVRARALRPSDPRLRRLPP